VPSLQLPSLWGWYGFYDPSSQQPTFFIHYIQWRGTELRWFAANPLNKPANPAAVVVKYGIWGVESTSPSYEMPLLTWSHQHTAYFLKENSIKICRGYRVPWAASGTSWDKININKKTNQQTDSFVWLYMRKQVSEKHRQRLSHSLWL